MRSWYVTNRQLITYHIPAYIRLYPCLETKSLEIYIEENT